MLTDIIEQRIALLLENSSVKNMIVKEMEQLIKERPLDIGLQEYCTTVALYYLKELCQQTVRKCKAESGQIGTVSTGVSDSGLNIKEVLHALLTWSQYELLGSNLQMVKALGSAIAMRDTGTSEHNLKVTLYATRIAEKSGLARKQIQAIMKGSFLHDIGKIGIPDSTLLKADKLSGLEFKQMQSHVIRGAQIIKGVTWLEDARDVILYHHERWDGSGYPSALKGNQIPINARIFMIVDVFDALTSDRPYKKAMSYETTLVQMKNESGAHFDPYYFQIFHDFSGCLISEYCHLKNEELEKQIYEDIVKYFDPHSQADHPNDLGNFMK